MVERVARSRISVPAAAAIGAVSAGLLVAGSAFAASRDATLQIRVQVVDSCQVRLRPGGGLDQDCGSGELLQPMVTTSDGVEPLAADDPAQPGAAEGKGSSAGSASAASAGREAPSRAVAASQRANGVAAQIVERVRYIALTY